MLVARIEITAGPARGTRTYAEVDVDADGIAQRYRPVDHPFEPGLASPGGLAGPVPAEQAALLAPCAPRVVLGMAHNTGADDRLLAPQAFHKSPHSVVGPGHPIELEPGHDSVDAEGEIAAVIGRVARNLTPDNALDAIYGYTIGNDVTDRYAQATESRWTEAKSRDTYTPLGPWICTDLDPSDLTIRLGDDDGLTSEGSTSGLARGIADVLVYITSVLTLHPGDVVLAGAPDLVIDSGRERSAESSCRPSANSQIRSSRCAARAGPDSGRFPTPGCRAGRYGGLLESMV